MSRCPRCGAEVFVCDECIGAITGRSTCVMDDEGEPKHFCNVDCWRMYYGKKVRRMRGDEERYNPMAAYLLPEGSRPESNWR